MTTGRAVKICVVLIAASLPLSLVQVVDWSGAITRLVAIVVGLLTVGIASMNRISRRLTPTVVIVILNLLAISLVAYGGICIEVPTSKALLPGLPIEGLAAGRTQWCDLHANELGGLLALLVPVLLATSARLPNLASKGAFVITACATTMLVLTQSRSALLATTLALGTVVLVMTQKRLAASIGVAVAISALIFALGGTWLVAAERGSDTLPGRLELWQSGMMLLQRAPLSGVGLGQVDLMLHIYTPTVQSTADERIPHVHNQYLQLALDLGAIGGLGLLLLAAVVSHRLWMLSHCKRSDSSVLSLGLFAGLVAYGLYGIADAIAPGARGGLVVWIVMGLAVGHVARSEFNSD